MVKTFRLLICCSLFILSLSSIAKDLDNSQLYTVPEKEQWLFINISKSECRICTADIYIQSGNAKINGIWVSGNYNFSIVDDIEILFDSSAVFALGDVVNRVRVQEISIDD